jgi:heat shock protein HtpX
MYEQISANKWKSIALVFFFMAFIFLLTWVFEQATGWGTGGLVLALIVSMGMAAVGYYSSDKIVLAISKARPATKEEFPHLYNTVEGLAIAAGIPAPRCYVIEDTAMNAFATGRNPENSVICVTTGLLAKMDRVELEGVVAHEMSHIKNYDIRFQTLIVVMAGIVVLLSDWILRGFFWGGGRRRSGRGRGGLASALRKIAADTEPLEAANKATAHLYIANPLKNVKGAVNKLFSTHPPIEERIAALEKM